MINPEHMMENNIVMKYRMDVEYSDVKKPKPKTNPKYVDDHKRTYGFRTQEELRAYRMGIEAASYVYDFDLEIKTYEVNK